MKFSHPGVSFSLSQLNYIKANQNIEPFASIFLKMKNSMYGDLNYIVKGPPANGIISSGPYNNPDIGASSEDLDATTAVTQAILWYITGIQAYATNTQAILNNYSNLYKKHTNSNALLQVSWTAEKFPIAAEIMKFTNSGWSSENQVKFSDMLKKMAREMLNNNGNYNGNWVLSKCHGLILISIYLDDTKMFFDAVSNLKSLIPAYIYISSDGSSPKRHKTISQSWNNQKLFNTFVNGISQETCRDLGHTQLGLGSMFGALEACYIQNLNYYDDFQMRLVSTLEFHSKLLNGTASNDILSNLGKIQAKYIAPTFEIGYNAYVNRGVAGEKKDLPETKNQLENSRQVLNYSSDNKYRHSCLYEILRIKK